MLSTTYCIHSGFVLHVNKQPFRIKLFFCFSLTKTHPANLAYKVVPLCQQLILVEFHSYISSIIFFSYSNFYLKEKKGRWIIMNCHTLAFCSRLTKLMNTHLTTFKSCSCPLQYNFTKWQKRIHLLTDPNISSLYKHI